MALDERDWVEAAYRLILGRSADPEGLRIHLSARLSPEALAQTFLHSAEVHAKQLATTTRSIHGLEFVMPADETAYHESYEPHVY